MTLSGLEKRAHKAVDELSETAATDEFEGWQTELKAAHSAITALAEAGRAGVDAEKVRKAFKTLRHGIASLAGKIHAYRMGLTPKSAGQTQAECEKAISLLEDALRGKP